MEQKLGLQQNNKGLSLVELIVTILISSVVMLAVVGLLTTGLNMYKNVSAETRLQTEGQAACGRINELVQEAQHLEIYTRTDILGLGNNKVLVLMTQKENPADPNDQGWWYYIVWDAEGKMLLLTKKAVAWNDGVLNVPSKAEIEETVGNMIDEPQKKKYLLAQYIETFKFKKIESSDKSYTNLYSVDILLATEGKQFSISRFISERNK